MREVWKVNVITALFLVVSAVGAQSEPGPKPQFSLVLSTERTEFSIGAPISFKLTMTNVSDSHFHYDVRSLASKALNYKYVQVRPVRVELRDGEGKPVPLTLYGATARGQCGECGGSGIQGGLKPGESISETVDLSKEFDIQKPGKYTVYAERFDKASKTLVKSSILTINLVR